MHITEDRVPSTMMQAFPNIPIKHAQSSGSTGSADVSNDIAGNSDIRTGIKKTATITTGPSSTFSIVRTGSEKKQKPKEWIFGLQKTQRAVKDQVPSQEDYEQKYSPDAYGEELGPNARVYKVYMDEALKHDEETVEGWRDNLDVLLVFAGLFSAVVTTFVVQSSSKLTVDWSEVNSHLLVESNTIQRALAAGTPLGNVPVSMMSPAVEFVPAVADRWINGLWFVSLCFSLATALFAVLVKQWLKHYRSTIGGSARDRAHMTQSRREALEKWSVPTIVGLLPLLLHTSLFMFFAGLAVFLYPLDKTTFRITVAILVISLTAYVITTLLPITFPECPYVTPLTSAAHATIQSFKTHMVLIKLKFRLLELSILAWHERMTVGRIALPSPLSRNFYQTKQALEDLRRSPIPNLSMLEKESICNATPTWDARVLTWLQSTTSLQPTISPILLQSIAGLPVDYPKPLSKLLIQANIHQFYPSQIKPWAGILTGTECGDPRQLYQERREDTVERYIRASVQINAHLYNGDHVSTFDVGKFHQMYGPLLFSLPCFFNAWEGMSQYGNECQYIRDLCATPWHKAEQPGSRGRGFSRYALIFTAFLRLQASTNTEDAQQLHPIVWEQLLLYVAEYIRLQVSLPGSEHTDEFTTEEEQFMRRSAQVISYAMICDRYARQESPILPAFALHVQFPDGSAQEENSRSMWHSTTLFQLPRNHYLLRFLFLSATLGKSLTPWAHRCHRLFPIKFDFMWHFPERYLASLIQLLDYKPIATETGSTALTSEVATCTAYIRNFFDRGAMGYSAAVAKLIRADTGQSSPDSLYAREWLQWRPISYIKAIYYAQERLSSFICEGDVPHVVQRNLVSALSECELCLRAIGPDRQYLTYTPTLMQKVIDLMFFPAPKRQLEDEFSPDIIWDENPVFHLLWRSFKNGSPSSLDVLVELNGVMVIIDGVRSKKQQRNLEQSTAKVYNFLVAVVLLGFIQGSLEQRSSELALTYISSPSVFAALCGILFPTFFEDVHLPPRVEQKHPLLKYNREVLWDTLLSLTKQDIAAFKAAWNEVFQRKIPLVKPNSKRSYSRVEELKDLLGLGSEPQFVQFVAMKSSEIPIVLQAQQEIMSPQGDMVEIDYRLVEPFLDENMMLIGHPQTTNARTKEPIQVRETVEENRKFSRSGALAIVALAARRRFRSDEESRARSQV